MTEIWRKIEDGLSHNELLIFSNSFQAQEAAIMQKTGEENKKIYSYALTGTSDYKGTKILQIRDPLDTQIYKKGWI